MSYGHGERLLDAIGAATPEAIKATGKKLTLEDVKPGYMMFRDLNDGRYMAVQVLKGREGLLVIGTFPNAHFDYAYRYPMFELAAMAFFNWYGEGDPPGEWIKEVPGGTKKRPDHHQGLE